MKNNSERRENFRVNDSALISYTQLDQAQVEQWRSAETNALPNAFDLASWLGDMRQKTTLLHRQARQEAPRLAEYVSVLERKFDRLLEVMLIRDMETDHAVQQSVDVGADGLGFAVDEYLEPGVYLGIHMLLLSGGTGLRLLGKVVRCEKAGGGEAGAYNIGVALEFRREADRELLLHHLLHRQSELIRAGNLEDSDSH